MPPKIPKRSILTKEDLEKFQTSQVYTEYMDFITSLNESIKNKALDVETKQTDATVRLLEILQELKKWVSDFPPEDVGLSRFGNPSFRKWYDRLEVESEQLLSGLVPNEYVDEVRTYLNCAFGDRARIDYGTGHEANFMCFLLCLYKLKVFDESDNTAIVFKVFWSYIDLMRKLQNTYWLEPAGSHGVWGLDDYHFLPFLFGSGQLHDHRHLRPKSIHSAEILEEFGDKFMYLYCVRHINSIKSASLRWHSPMLDDISGVKKWDKVNAGMFKMYRAEVFNKLPIMQHFLFGSLLNFEGSANEKFDPTKEHVHAYGEEHPLCCSIRVPSAVAANQANHQRTLPFD